MRAIFAFIVALLAMLPAAAIACPNCYAASGHRAMLAYYASTMILSLMPFALIGAVILVVVLMRNAALRRDS